MSSCELAGFVSLVVCSFKQGSPAMLVHPRCLIHSCDARNMLCTAVPAAVSRFDGFAVKISIENSCSLKDGGN